MMEDGEWPAPPSSILDPRSSTFNLVHLTSYQVKKLYSDVDRRALVAGNQTLRLHHTGVSSLAWRAKSRRIYRPKIPPLPILHRRRPVGIKHVAFVQHRLGNLVYKFQVHCSELS